MANVLYDLGHQNIGILLVVCDEDRIEGGSSYWPQSAWMRIFNLRSQYLCD
jgi:hypothetical protein